MSNFNIAYKYSLRDAFSAKLKKINKLSKKHSVILKSIHKDIKAVSRQYKKFALVGVAAFAGVTIAAAGFQSGLTDTLNLLDKATISKFSDDLSKAQENAVLMGFGLSDANKSLFDTVSAIGDVDKSLDIFNIAQKLAVGGASSLSVSVDGLTSVINAYGKAQTDATEVANAFFSAQRAGKTTVAELSANIGKVAPLAKQAGVGYKTLLASVSQLTLGGLSTEESTTALRGAIAGLLKPTDQAKKVFKALEKHLGVNLPIGASALQAADFADVLANLAIVAKKAPDALAEMIPNIRALTAISALSSDKVENMRKIISNMNKDFKTGTGLNEAYNRKLKDVTQQFKMARGAMLVMAARFGKDLLPVATKFLKVLTRLMSFLMNLSPAIKKTILVLGGLVTAFTGVVVAIGSFVALKGILIPTLAILSKGFLLFWGAVTGPVGIAIAAVGALVALGVLLYKKWEPFRNLVDSIFEKIKSLMATIKASKFGQIILKLTDKLTNKEQPSDLNNIGNKLTENQGLGNGSFDANININAPKGVVGNVKTKEKKANGFNLGLNMAEGAA